MRTNACRIRAPLAGTPRQSNTKRLSVLPSRRSCCCYRRPPPSACPPCCAWRPGSSASAPSAGASQWARLPNPLPRPNWPPLPFRSRRVPTQAETAHVLLEDTKRTRRYRTQRHSLLLAYLPVIPSRARPDPPRLSLRLLVDPVLLLSLTMLLALRVQGLGCRALAQNSGCSFLQFTCCTVLAQNFCCSFLPFDPLQCPRPEMPLVPLDCAGERRHRQAIGCADAPQQAAQAPPPDAGELGPKILEASEPGLPRGNCQGA